MTNRRRLALCLSLIAFYLLALALPAAATSVVRRAVPQGWQVYRGPDGLVLIHPQGWQVQRGMQGSFMVSGRVGDGGVAVALMQPVQIDGRAQGVVQGLGQIYPEVFPGLNVSQVQMLSQNPDVAQGRLEYQVQGQTYHGWALCFKDGNQGVIYAMSSRAPDWPRVQGALKDILRGFFYAAAPGAPEGGGPPPGLPAMTNFRDPVEGAFTCPVPQGWKVEGGMRRYAAVDVRPELLATSPDGAILIRIGDAQVPSMVIPNQMLNMTGFTEGKTYSPGYGLHQLVMRYLPGAEFITKYYLPRRLGQYGALKANQLPELTQKLQALYQKSGLPIRTDVGEARFETNTQGGRRKGYIFAQTTMFTAPGGNGVGMWTMEKFGGYLAPPGQEGLAEAVLLAMVSGFQVDPNWQAQQSQLTGNVSRIVTETNHAIQGIIKSTFEYKTKVTDRALERYDRHAIRGNVVIEDPNTGQRYEVPGGSNYYWQRGNTGTFVGTDSDTKPNSPNYWFNRMNVVD